MHTDTQVHRAAQRRLFMGAGDFRRSIAVATLLRARV